MWGGLKQKTSLATVPLSWLMGNRIKFPILSRKYTFHLLCNGLELISVKNCVFC
jgi:hypothetical protein